MRHLDGDAINEALEALEALGATLAIRGLSVNLVIVGGGDLVYSGLVTRTVTRDLDVIGRLEEGAVVEFAIPQPLAQAILDVARQFDLAPDWINTGPMSLLANGLPHGFVDRLEREDYAGALTVWFAARRDIIALKLYAAANPTLRDPNPGRHFQDLSDLGVTAEELAFGRSWMTTWADADLLAAADAVAIRLAR
jgi:hypothetical protein